MRGRAANRLRSRCLVTDCPSSYRSAGAPPGASDVRPLPSGRAVYRSVAVAVTAAVAAVATAVTVAAAVVTAAVTVPVPSTTRAVERFEITTHGVISRSFQRWSSSTICTEVIRLGTRDRYR